MFGKRIATALIGLPIAIFLITLGGLPFLTIIGVISLIGLYEFYKATSGKILPVHIAGYTSVPIYFFILHSSSDVLHLFLLGIILLLVVLAMLVLLYKTVSITDCAITIFGFYYIPVLFSFAYMTREHYLGSFFVWIIFISAWGSDSGAYIFGKLFGRNKLAPVLSPKKTVEGALGGVFVAALIAFAYAALMLRFSSIDIDEAIPVVLICVISGAVGSVFSQFGDLAASAIKRNSNIKDYGNIFPGHGGVMDRFDSVLFTAPCVFILIYFLA